MQAMHCFRWFQSFLIEPKPIGPLSLHRRLKKVFLHQSGAFDNRKDQGALHRPQV